MRALKCKPSAQFAYNYTINALSKCSNIISHRPSVFEVDTTTIDPRRSTHRSSKVDTTTINLRRSTHRSSKVDTSTLDLRRSTHRSSKIEGGNIEPTTQHRTDIPTIHHRLLSTMTLHSYNIRRSMRSIIYGRMYTRARPYT